MAFNFSCSRKVLMQLFKYTSLDPSIRDDDSAEKGIRSRHASVSLCYLPAHLVLWQVLMHQRLMSSNEVYFNMV